MKHKHIPQRTCVGCREVLPKRSLIRIVRSPQGVLVDATGKMAGRGAYLHDTSTCWDRGLRGALAHALKTVLTDEERTRLAAFAATLAASLSTDDAAPAATTREDGDHHG